jgi:hypothetical protein
MRKNKKHKIIILLTNTGTILSRIIKIYTREPYSHVSIGFDVELNKLYSFGRIYPRNPLIGGFIIENVNNGLYSIFTDTICAVYTLEVTEAQYIRMRQVVNEFDKEKTKYKYNFLGLLGIATSIPIERENAYFCSQFAATVLEKSGIEIFNKQPELITPYDFRISKHLKLIYTGKLLDYNLKRLSLVI